MIGDAQNPEYHRISNISINGVYRSYWDGGTITAPALSSFLNQYVTAKNIPASVSNDYGTPAAKYMTTGKYIGIGGRASTTTNNNSSSQSNNNSATGNNSTSSNSDSDTTRNDR